MKKVFVLLLSIALLVSMLGACSSKPAETADVGGTSAPESGEEPLEGHIVVGTNRTNIADTLLTDFAEKFMEKHPGCTVEFEGIKDLEQTMMTRMTADEMPDVSILLYTKLTPDDYSQYFLPLDDLGFTSDDFYFYENGLGTDGHLYQIIPDMYTNCVFYNKAAFEKAGIEKAPTTMEELEEACEKLKAVGITPFGTSFRDLWPLRGWFSGFYSQIGFTGNRNFMSDLVKSDTLLDDTEYGNKYFLDIARDFAQKGYLDPDLPNANWDDLRRDIISEKIAMFYDGAWYGPQLVYDAGLPAENCGAFPFPGAKNLTICPAWGYGVAKNTEYPELAKAFLKEMVTSKEYADICKAEVTSKHYQLDLPGVEELYSYNLPVIEMPNMDPELIEIFNEAQINPDELAQEYILSENPDEVVAKYNQKWKEAKAALGK